jgi:hypothetical protein
MDLLTEVWTYQHGSGYLMANGRSIRASCEIRNELNGQRKVHEVVKTFSKPERVPYYPRPFPIGTWKFTQIRDKRGNPETAPWFFATDAGQYVEEWELDDKGNYLKPTGKMVWDGEYGLHMSTYRTTLGCIKIMKESDILWMYDTIKKNLDEKRPLWLKVT